MSYPTITLGCRTYMVVPADVAAEHGITPDPRADKRAATGRRLRRAREKAGLTQAELGASLGVGQPYIASVELGRDPASQARIAEWLAACKESSR